MRLPSLRLLAPVLIASAALLAGCGGGGGRSTVGATTTSGGGKQSGAYAGGFEICSQGTVEEIAQLYGVPKSTPDAVANVIAEAVSGGSSPQDATDAMRGCADAFAQQK